MIINNIQRKYSLVSANWSRPAAAAASIIVVKRGSASKISRMLDDLESGKITLLTICTIPLLAAILFSLVGISLMDILAKFKDHKEKNRKGNSRPNSACG